MKKLFALLLAGTMLLSCDEIGNDKIVKAHGESNQRAGNDTRHNLWHDDLCQSLAGTLAAIGLSRSRRALRNVVEQVNNLPIMNPEIVTAIGLLIMIFPPMPVLCFGAMLFPPSACRRVGIHLAGQVH